ncbi:MAG TPA: YggT family protein [Burkholderiaceae bacterium]|nr:YggT family protein [Burkholderiaceae bacterium]
MSALWLLIETVGSLLATACVLRAVAWSQNLSARNPLMQFVIAITDWIVKPLRRIVPASRRVDWASIAAALILALVLAFFYSVLLLARSPMFGGVFFIALFWLCKWTVYLLIGLLLLQAVLSWVNPHAPIAPVIDALTRPFLAPVRRFIPLIGGVDLSPLVLIVVAQALLMVLESMLSTVLRIL